MTTVLVTGADGQLGQCIQNITHQFPSLDFLFADRNTLDITVANDVLDFFETNAIDWCINCAGYTAVDNAENDQENAYKVNSIGAKNMAQACQKNDVKMVHISTDFVFDGLKTTPYTELDKTNPVNVYGESKLKGENEIKQILDKHFIIRTSWLYSEYGNNFMKTMLGLAQDRQELSVVNDQLGTPTYAGDLAHVVLNIIKLRSQDYGVYHYSNEGITSWFEFAKAIFEESNIELYIIPIETKDYPTLTKRPRYSVLDKSKIKKMLNVEILDWRQSLRKALLKLNL
ncbi:dTDP-4-dehydrorhamnose reductase [Gelidibacter japonicus]|uniref:dTDP-4-dehydrorhamnose reductase n=1 Tax=Gelidibacter japonicus TaxID=1962232 RepID=UPI0020224177|nr:dTDP-4-dehydrorhamnose reductase [Gelidibacter japonicus]MCL8008114.1 dTDP-4-dehydrorhamnose reductase [Gelidibacter japonicus]